MAMAPDNCGHPRQSRHCQHMVSAQRGNKANGDDQSPRRWPV